MSVGSEHNATIHFENVYYIYILLLCKLFIQIQIKAHDTNLLINYNASMHYGIV